jgi:ATP-dependent DNA ligase
MVNGDGLYLGRRKGDDLIYAGNVDHGFDNDTAKDLQARLKPLIRNRNPTVSASHIAASGLNRHCWPRSSTWPNPPRATCGTQCSRG